MSKIKENIISWVFGAVCAIVCGAIVLIISVCSAKADIGATVNIPDIKVYIKGEINSPGLYTVDADTRLTELIDIAGGAAENADLDRINLAVILMDGTTVTVPAVGDEKVDSSIAITPSSTYAPSSAGNAGPSAEKISSGAVNINSASIAELTRLPGVGEATAKKIISYREQKGRFLSIEEIMNVSGIGQKTFEKMKQFIAVE